MVDVDFLSPTKNQCILTTHTEALSRASRGTGVVNGNRLLPTEPVTMTVTVQAGRIRIAGEPVDVAEDAVEIDAAHATYPRIDVIYRDEAGDAQVAKGTPAAIEDPKNLANWKSYTSPTPPESIPAGAILGAVYIPAEGTTVPSSNIWMFAAGIEDLATSISDPGVDTRAASEKAVRDAIDGCAPAAQGVTDGNTHAHTGGKGAQIDHVNLANKGSNTHAAIDSHIANTSNPHAVTAAQVGADITTGTVHAATAKTSLSDTDEMDILDGDASYILKKITWANVKVTLLAAWHAASSKSTPADADELEILDSAASFVQKKLTWANLKATLNTIYAPIAKGVTNGDSHDHSGGDGAQIDHGGLAGLADDDHTQYLLLSGRTGRQILHGRSQIPIVTHQTGEVDNALLLHDAYIVHGTENHPLSGPTFAHVGYGDYAFRFGRHPLGELLQGDGSNFIPEMVLKTPGYIGLGNIVDPSVGFELPNTPVAGDIKCHAIESRAAAGFPPIKVISATKVDNLNVSYLEGNAASAFAPAAQGVTNGNNHDHNGGDGAQIDHGGLAGLGDDDHTQYYNQSRGDARYAPIAKGVTNGDSHDHNGGDGGTIAYSSLSGKPTRKFAVPFVYGDGYSVIPTSTEVQSYEVEIPVACTITAVRIHERYNTTGNLTVKLWRRTYDGEWNQLDEYTITGGYRYEETGLSIALAAGDWITAEVSSVSSMTQISCSFTMEPT